MATDFKRTRSPIFGIRQQVNKSGQLDFSKFVVESVANQGIFPHTGFFMVMVFGAFSKMIGGMPVQAVVKTLDLECKMLEEDVEHHRLALDGDALSILRFGRFVRMVKSGEVMRRLEFIPLDHLEFYKETLVRLVNATELPASVMEQFEYAFPLML